MELRYLIYDPTKNVTALVTTPVPRRDHAAAAAALMAALPAVEQTGFLEEPSDPAARLRLQMMGGEFCGNAAMSAAAYLAERDGLPDGAADAYPLEVSGNSGVLRCRIEHRGPRFFGTVAMPLPESIGSALLPPVGAGGVRVVPAVRLPGIVHCILPAPEVTREQAEAELRPQLPTLCARLRTGACGLLLFDELSASFAPLVYVASTDTAVWESGCGSGSAAIGAYLASRDGASRDIALRQSGGIIRVRARWEKGTVAALTITGQVYGTGGGSMEVEV